MAEKAEKPAKSEADAAPVEGVKKPGMMGLFKSTPVVLGLVMFLEAGILFAGFKFLGGGPKGAAGAELTTGDGHADGHNDGAHDGKGGKPTTKAVELPVLEFKAPNKQTGRTIVFDVAIYAVAKAEHKETVEQTLKGREATIKDRIRTIIAQSDPDKLGGGSEPGLETLRRQVKYQLDELLGEGMIEEVLVPRCIPYRLDY